MRTSLNSLRNGIKPYRALLLGRYPARDRDSSTEIAAARVEAAFDDALWPRPYGQWCPQKVAPSLRVSPPRPPPNRMHQPRAEAGALRSHQTTINTLNRLRILP